MRKTVALVALLSLPACAGDPAGENPFTASDADAPTGDSQIATDGDVPTQADLLAECFPNWSFNPEVVHKSVSPQLDDHVAFLSLLQSLMATHSAGRSGAWEDPGTWSGSQVPTAGAVVDIPRNTVVTIGSRLDAPLK